MCVCVCFYSPNNCDERIIIPMRTSFGSNLQIKAFLGRPQYTPFLSDARAAACILLVGARKPARDNAYGYRAKGEKEREKERK